LGTASFPSLKKTGLWPLADAIPGITRRGLFIDQPGCRGSQDIFIDDHIRVQDYLLVGASSKAECKDRKRNRCRK